MKDKDRSTDQERAEPTRNGTHAARAHDVDRGAQAVGRAKFDLGSAAATLPSQNIPWGYGENRVTAMARDPDWLYAYWEITDSAIDDAAKKLGRGGRNAWCCLRVYDTTGQVFDGTNANSYFDIAIERTSRDWFVHIGRPASACHVEVGLKSRDGSFRAIARSGRTEFPRKRPVQDMTLEWLTVEAMQPPGDPPPVTHPYVSRYEGPPPDLHAPTRTPLSPPQPTVHTAPVRVAFQHQVEHRETWRNTWTERRSYAWTTRVIHRYEGTHHRLVEPWMNQRFRSEWQGEEPAFDWLRPLHRLTWTHVTQGNGWNTAPYPGDSAAPGRVVVRYAGDTHVISQSSGSRSVVLGPWEVIIRSPSFEGPQRRVVGSWKLHWAQPATQVRSQWTITAERIFFSGFTREYVLPGASENTVAIEGGASELWSFGASEQVWLGSSELVIAGASEQVWLGASEQRIGGASEAVEHWAELWLGASELALETGSHVFARGASELVTIGASEVWVQSEAFPEAASAFLVTESFLGASEQLHDVSWVTELVGGASELIGASEQWGASEYSVSLPGASDLVASPPSLGGASEHAPGITGPQNAGPSAVQRVHSPPWTPEGASDEVARATFPLALDDDDPTDPRDQ